MPGSHHYARAVPLLIALAVLPASRGGPGHAFREPVTDGPTVGRQTLDFELVRGHLIAARATIDGIVVKLLLDTGTYRTVIDSRIAGDQPGTPDRMHVFGQMVPARRVTVPSLELGPVQVVRPQVLAADLSGLRQRLGTDADGIVGLDALRGRCLIVDYEARRLRFTCDTTWTANVSCAADSPYLVAATTIDAREYRLLVDSGSDAIALFERSAGPHVGDGEVTAETVIGIVRLRRFVASVGLGAISLGSQSVHVIPGGGPDGSPEFDGVIGLRRIAPRVQLDFERKAISWDR